MKGRPGACGHIVQRHSSAATSSSAAVLLRAAGTRSALPAEAGLPGAAPRWATRWPGSGAAPPSARARARAWARARAPRSAGGGMRWRQGDRAGCVQVAEWNTSWQPAPQHRASRLPPQPGAHLPPAALACGRAEGWCRLSALQALGRAGQQPGHGSAQQAARQAATHGGTAQQAATPSATAQQAAAPVTRRQRRLRCRHRRRLRCLRRRRHRRRPAAQRWLLRMTRHDGQCRCRSQTGSWVGQLRSAPPAGRKPKPLSAATCWAPGALPPIQIVRRFSCTMTALRRPLSSPCASEAECNGQGAACERELGKHSSG